MGVLLPTTDLLGTAETSGKHIASRPDHENLIPLFPQNLMKWRDTPHVRIYCTIHYACNYNNNNIQIVVCNIRIVYFLVDGRTK